MKINFLRCISDLHQISRVAKLQSGSFLSVLQRYLEAALHRGISRAKDVKRLDDYRITWRDNRRARAGSHWEVPISWIHAQRGHVRQCELR